MQRTTNAAHQLIYESDSFANTSGKSILPRLVISFNKDDYTLNNASVNTELGVPISAEGLSVKTNQSVTGAASTVGADLLYIRNNYALKSEIPTTQANAATALYLKDANGKVYEITVDTSGNLVATAQEE